MSGNNTKEDTAAVKINGTPTQPEPPVEDEHTRTFYIIVCLTFVASGAMSTIASKWSDTLSAEGRDGDVKKFDHPFVQTWLMFIGEFTCMITFTYSVWMKNRRGEKLREGVDYCKPVSRFIFAIPAACDFTATTTMYYALTMTEASVYQMLRGATVVFTGLMSKFFLRRQFQLYQWFGMFTVTVGLALVGLSSTLFGKKDTSASNPILGDILVIAAQVIVSTQMIVEEKILTKYNVPPTMLVAWEGVYGMIYATTALCIFQAFPKEHRPDDFIDAAYQCSSSWRVAFSNFLALLSFPLLNGTGQIITKNISATARMVLDTVRNVIVWVFTLAYTSYFHEHFQWLQLIGFIGLITGNAIYKYIIRIPCDLCRDKEVIAEREGERAALLDGSEDQLKTQQRLQN